MAQYKAAISQTAKEALAMEERKKALYPTKVVSANTLHIKFENYMKKSILTFNQQNIFKSMKDSCFSSDYDIIAKNKAF